MMELEHILAAASAGRASDIHITAGAPVMLRVHGRLVPHGERPLTEQDTARLAEALLSEQGRQAFAASGDLDLAYRSPAGQRCRVNVFRQRGGTGLTVRLVPEALPELGQLGLPAAAARLAERSQGLVLVTGPTGSGKTTTLAALVHAINERRSCHIVTLEDPIEFEHRHKRSIVNQREIGRDTASFAAGLRAALRQDPDVLLIGELRDLETIATAVTAAETGHLVFATLHTADAAQTIDRIIDVFPPQGQQQIRVQLAAVLAGVIAQRLLPTVGGGGRVAACEIMVNTPAIANLIRTDKVHQIRSIIQTGRHSGMQTMEQALRELVRQGLVTEEQARQAVGETADLSG
ncbi:type IV pilus twitching motility protein PilT [Paenibacillus sp. IB182496]|uniref:Type IV pilus twitching motility protein PilT n=1 Tax=Paenibacillus sabuli TaxID=2772509 RepID=A0A927BXK8_9BACL|nr:type IV pilus twitching motility protein PilT [Paenibacillus sabuli]MBD2848212.1 type IV pilus twitching motility protein PilT [Paenibacillus sabuli]